MSLRFLDYISGYPFVDVVYARGTIVRIDQDANSIRSTLDALPFDTSNAVWGGVFQGYKSHYGPTMVSVYFRGSLPWNESSYYGIKYNYETDSILYKAEVPSFENPFSFPLASCSKTWDADGNELPIRDYYTYANTQTIFSFCEEHGLEKPLDDDWNVWIWGITTNENNVPTIVKAYRKGQ